MGGNDEGGGKVVWDMDTYMHWMSHLRRYPGPGCWLIGICWLYEDGEVGGRI